jgi:hypothetical protein
MSPEEENIISQKQKKIIIKMQQEKAIEEPMIRQQIPLNGYGNTFDRRKATEGKVMISSPLESIGIS